MLPKVLDSSDISKIGDKIRDKRTSLGWTQADLASEAGVTNNTVSRIEGAQMNPSITTFLAITNALGGPIDDYLPPAYRKKPVMSSFSEFEEKLMQLSPENQKLVHNSLSAMLDGLLSQQIEKA